MRAPDVGPAVSTRRTTAAVRAVALALAVLTLTACGQTTTETVTRTVTKAAATTTAHETTTVASAPTRKHRPAKAAAAPRSSSLVWTACDANVSVVQPHTSCGFAQNAFYEYWSSGSAPTIRVYSPALRASLTTRCVRGVRTVVCRTGDGGRARFLRTALEAYSSSQAASYAATHDLGGGAASTDDDAVPASSSGDDEETSAWPPYNERIPNFDEGRGSVVRCADGMYSQSGGLQGACSGHGGVGG